MMETLTIFDDVFVPKERVFMDGEWQFAGPLARTFVEFIAFTAISYKLPLLDLLVGSALLIAEQNGIERAGHVREKLTWLISYAETVRMLHENGGYPLHHRRRRRHSEPLLQSTSPSSTLLPTTIRPDASTGSYRRLLVTGPGEEDLKNPETGKYINHYLGGAGVSGEQRLRTINLISDLTTGEFGGYQAALAITPRVRSRLKS